MTSHVSERALRRLGKVIHHYRIERLLGIGGMAAVYAATDPDGHRVAIKLMHERFQDDLKMVRLFRREAEVANQVGHPGAVPVLAHDVDDEGCAFLVLPLLEGETLRVRWDRAKRRLPVSEIAVVMADVLDVLATAHRKGIVHCDIKPENLFVESTGHGRVLDFGIARRLDAGGAATITGHMIGTPAFMPPEQALGDRAATGPHSDCWALGATIFTLLSGEFVHAADSAQAQLAAAATRRARSLGDVMTSLPRSIVSFVDKALAFETTGRWPSAREMREALLMSFGEALGEPVLVLAARVRDSLVADLARTSTDSHVAETLRAGRPIQGAAALRQRVSRVEPGIEAAGGVLQRAFHLIPEVAHPILARYGLGQITESGTFILDERRWWPLNSYVDCLHEIASAAPDQMTEICKLIEKYSDRPPTARDIHTAFASLDVAYHLAHRKDGRLMFDVTSGRMLEGIGHQRYRGTPGDNFIAIESDDPYPCDVERGIHFGIARRLEPHSVVEHAPGRCRKHGDESCVYFVRWW